MKTFLATFLLSISAVQATEWDKLSPTEQRELVKNHPNLATVKEDIDKADNIINQQNQKLVQKDHVIERVVQENEELKQETAQLQARIAELEQHQP